MKQIWKYAMIAVAAVAAACNEKEPLQEETPLPGADGKYAYTFAIGDTKSIVSADHIAWEKGDKVGWFTDIEGASEVDVTTSPRTFTVQSDAPLAAGATVYVYAPFREEGQSKTAVAMTIPAEQTQTGTFDGDAMPLVALPVTVTDAMTAGVDTPVGEVQFLNLGSLIQYNVFTTNAAYAGETLKSVGFKASAALAGDFSIDLTQVTDGHVPAPDGLSADEVVTSLSEAVGGSKAEAVAVYQVVAPGTYTGVVTVTTDKAAYSYDITEAKTYARASLKPLAIDLATGVRTEIEPPLTSPYAYYLKDGDFGVTTTTIYQADLVNPSHLGGAVWSLDGAKAYKWADGSDAAWRTGLRVGNASTSLNAFTIKSSSFPGVISKVTLGYNSQYAVNVSCTVGGKAFGPTVTHAEGETSAVFDALGSGEIAISFNFDGNSFIYLQSLKVEFDADASLPEPSELECPYEYWFADGDFGLTTTETYTSSPLSGVFGGLGWTLAIVSNNGGDKMYQWTGDTGWNRNAIQVGYRNNGAPKEVTLSTAGVPGVVTKITLYYITADNQDMTASATVGGAAFGSPVAHVNEAYEAVFTGSASGSIVLRITSDSATWPPYIKGVRIEYDPDGEVIQPEPDTKINYDHLFVSGDFGLGSSTQTTISADLAGSVSGQETINWSLSAAEGVRWWVNNYGWGGGDSITVTDGETGWWGDNSAIQQITLSSSGFKGTIFEVTVDVVMSEGVSLTLSANVGGNSFGEQKTVANSVDGATPSVTFTGEASGTVSVTIQRTVGTAAILLHGVHVTYKPD